MKKLVLICGILANALTVGYSAMSEYEIKRVTDNWVKNEDKNTFKAMIDESLASVEQCKEEGKDSCLLAGVVYSDAGYYRKAIPYFEKIIALGDNGGYHLLGLAYYGLDDYLNAKKYYEISCNTNNDGQALSCHSLGISLSNMQARRVIWVRKWGVMITKDTTKQVCNSSFAYSFCKNHLCQKS